MADLTNYNIVDNNEDVAVMEPQALLPIDVETVQYQNPVLQELMPEPREDQVLDINAVKEMLGGDLYGADPALWLDENPIDETIATKEVEFPVHNFDAMMRVTQNYVNKLVKPYADAIEAATTTDSLLQWLPLVFQDKDLEILTNEVNAATDLEYAKGRIISFMNEILVLEAKKENRAIVTPWSIASRRDDKLTQLFGPVADKISVQVEIGPNKYDHLLSEEFTFGLLSVLTGNGYTLWVEGEKLSLDDIKPNYVPRDIQKEIYRAVLPSGEAVFNSPDVIQGVITAAKWLNVDPRAMVVNFTGVIDGQVMALNF